MPSSDAKLQQEARHAGAAKLSPAGESFGMVLFLASLSMLFAASMLGYLIIRLSNLSEVVHPVTGEVVRQAGPPLGTIHMPWPLWVSTAIILASSYTIHSALVSVQHERQSQFRLSLTITLLLAAAFVVVQAPSLGVLLAEHFEAMSSGGIGTTLFGFVFFLILIHALHVVGGVVPLFIATLHAHGGRYDHEHYGAVRRLAMYWHFLDVVWIVMFSLMLIAG